MTGKSIQDFPYEWQMRYIREQYDLVLSERRPVLSTRYFLGQDVLPTLSALALPLGTPETGIDHILNVASPLLGRRRRPGPSLKEMDRRQYSQDCHQLSPDEFAVMVADRTG
jgi:hypothetical protein